VYPDSVSRVRPPNITIPKTLAALPRSQYATALSLVAGKKRFLDIVGLAPRLNWLNGAVTCCGICVVCHRDWKNGIDLKDGWNRFADALDRALGDA